MSDYRLFDVTFRYFFFKHLKFHTGNVPVVVPLNRLTKLLDKIRVDKMLNALVKILRLTDE